MFGLGHWELLLVLFVALLIFGKRLPSVARSVGRSILSFKQGLREVDVRSDLDEVLQGQHAGSSGLPQGEAASVGSRKTSPGDAGHPE